MLDHWEQMHLPKLSELPDLGANSVKKYSTSKNNRYTCFALTYNGESLWDTLKMNKNKNNVSQQGYCSPQCAAQIGIDMIQTI